MVIKESVSIVYLNLQGNNIGPIGLQQLCSVLTDPKASVNHLDIRNNHIPDYALKILLAMLYQNNSLMRIDYDVTDPENVTKLQDYKKVESLSIDRLKNWLKKEMNEELHLKTWHKIVFPVWFWKTLMHAKHEAFRFKYETTKMT